MAGQVERKKNRRWRNKPGTALPAFWPIRIRVYASTAFVLLYSTGYISLYGSTPNGSCSRDVVVWPDGELGSAAVGAGGVNTVDALGNGANDGTSAENPLSGFGDEKFDFV